MFGIDPLTAATLLILAGSSGGPSCVMPKPTEINVIPRSEEVVYDYTQTLADLQRHESGTINPYSFQGTTIHKGFAENPIRLETRISLDYAPVPRYNALCLWYDKIEITMNITPRVTIAREIYEDRCMHKAVLEHEMKHVKEARRVANAFARMIGAEVHEALKQRGFIAGPVAGANGPHIQGRMQKVVHQIIEHQTRKMEIDYIERQSAIDSLEEYERVSALCPPDGGKKRRNRRR